MLFWNWTADKLSMDYKLFLSGFLTAFSTERSKIGPIPLILLNWAAVAIPAFLAYLALGTNSFFTMLGITFGALLVVVGYSTVLSLLRVKKRKRFHKTVRWGLGLQSYGDIKKDSSRFVKVRWNFLNATRLSFTIVVSNITLRNMQNIINDINSMFPQKDRQWIIDLSTLSQGAFLAEAVLFNSEEAYRFNAVMMMTDIARDHLHHSGFPVPISFINESIGPKGFTSDEIHVEKMRPRPVGRLAEERLLNLVNRNYPCEEDKTWDLDESSDNSLFRFYQEDKAKAKAMRHMRFIVHDNMSGFNLEHPTVTFIDESIERGQFFFESVIVEGLKAQGLSLFKAERLYAALDAAFPLLKNPETQWQATMESDTLTICRVKATEEEESAEESEEETAEVVNITSAAPSEPVSAPRAPTITSTLSLPPMSRPGDLKKKTVQAESPKIVESTIAKPALPKMPRPPTLPQLPPRPVLRPRDTTTQPLVKD